MEVNGQQNWLPASWTYDKLIVWYDGTFIFGVLKAIASGQTIDWVHNL